VGVEKALASDLQGRRGCHSCRCRVQQEDKQDPGSCASTGQETVVTLRHSVKMEVIDHAP